MRKLSLGETVKTYAAFAGVATVTLDAGLFLAARAGLDIPGSAFVDLPLSVITLAGLPASIHLFTRFMHQVGKDKTSIVGYEDNGGAPILNRIKLTANGRSAGTLLAHSVPSIFGKPEPAQPERKPAAWWIQIGDMPVTIREGELVAFLEQSAKRGKHQFSQTYWTQTRRPAMPRQRYDAIMLLLVSAGLVEGRAAGASGRLVTKPRHAITFLKHESRYAVS